MVSRELHIFAALIGTLFFTSGVNAQDAGRFQFRRGQVLQYQVEQNTRATDFTSEGKYEHTSHVEQTKRWQVLEVARDGTATLRLSLMRLTMQQRLPNGDTLQYDSTTPDRSHKQLREQLGPLVGKPLVQVRVDATGKVLEAKPLLQGSSNRYKSELPFIITLPGTTLQSGQTWTRNYDIVLDPPLGAGEKFAAEQSYQVAERAASGEIVLKFSTTIKNPPSTPPERLPLLQMQPRGEVLFDPRLGLVTNARVSSGGTVEGHGGEGSRYEFTSEYQEKLVSR